MKRYRRPKWKRATRRAKKIHGLSGMYRYILKYKGSIASVISHGKTKYDIEITVPGMGSVNNPMQVSISSGKGLMDEY